MDAVKITVRGGKRRKVTTRDRSGAMAERYEVRWRVHLADGECRDFRQRFERAVEADQHVRLLLSVGLPDAPWRLDDSRRPCHAFAVAPRRPRSKRSTDPGPVTMWDGLQQYRSATWRTASTNGRKAHAYVLRAMA